jgi:O-antigen ligase
MSESAVTITMAGAALVALALLVPSVRRARAAGDLDASTALTLGMAWLITLPTAVATMSGGVTRRPDVFGELALILPGWYLNAARAAALLAALLAAVLLLRRVTSGRVPVHTAGLFAILLWTVAHLASGLQGGPLLTLWGGVLLVCLIAATVLPRGRGASLGAGIFGVTLAIASGLVAVFRHDVAFVEPCEEACGGLGFLGVLPSENLLGVALAASIPFAYLGFRGNVRYWFVAYLAGTAIATGSRTAVIASILATGALFIVRPQVDADRRTPARAAIAWLVLAGAVFGSVYFVQRDWDPSALTDRPALWSVAWDYIDRSPWLGYGPDRWTSLYASSEIPRDAQHSAHNVWLDVLFAAGWVGAALLIGIVVATLWSSGRARPGVLLALATIFMIGTTEPAWLVGTFDLLSFSLVALILTGQPEAAATGMVGAARSDRRVLSSVLSPLDGHVPVLPGGAELVSASSGPKRTRSPSSLR